jgi:hypothetical protein
VGEGTKEEVGWKKGEKRCEVNKTLEYTFVVAVVEEGAIVRDCMDNDGKDESNVRRWWNKPLVE